MAMLTRDAVALNSRRPRTVTVMVSIAMAVVMALSLPAPAVGSAPAEISRADVHWWWDTDAAVGRSKLVRVDNGLSAVVRSTGLPAGHAVTLWFIIFNNPAACSTQPCSMPADVFNQDTRADFYFGGGHVVGRGQQVFAGHLNVGQTAGSGKAELADADVAEVQAVPLTAPRDAEVVLALHSHGPAMQGPLLVDQLSSFLGGCITFLGPSGFADGPGDVPHLEGQCSTVQRSLHR